MHMAVRPSVTKQMRLQTNEEPGHKSNVTLDDSYSPVAADAAAVHKNLFHEIR
jgi:hypothetical protein